VRLVIGANLKDPLQEGLDTRQRGVIPQRLVENVEEEGMLGRGEEACVEQDIVKGAVVSVRNVLANSGDLVQQGQRLNGGVEGRLVDHLEEQICMFVKAEACKESERRKVENEKRKRKGKRLLGGGRSFGKWKRAVDASQEG